MTAASASSVDSSAIKQALAVEDYDTVIAEVHSAMTTDPMAAMSDPVINDWLGRRYRNIFIEEALADETAVKNSEAPFPLNKIDKREDRERVAKRMLKGMSKEEIDTIMPLAQIGPIENVTFVFAPGLLTGLLPDLAFQSIWPGIEERFGIRVIASDSHPMRPPSKNVEDLVNAIEQGIGHAPTAEAELITAEDNPVAPNDVILMGYSKGTPDILQLLNDRPDLAPRIRAVMGWAGAAGGSYLADDIFEQLSEMPMFNNVKDLTKNDVTRQVFRLAPVTELKTINRRIDEFDVLGAVESLTTGFRDQFLVDNADAINELGVPQFCFTGATSLLDVPYFQRQGTIKLNTYDQDNDMQLTQAQQMAFPSPSTTRLAMFNANHWDMSYDAFPWQRTMGSMHLKHKFARRAAISAIILFMAEIGLID